MLLLLFPFAVDHCSTVHCYACAAAAAAAITASDDQQQSRNQCVPKAEATAVAAATEK
jgi:hypothetical protein